MLGCPQVDSLRLMTDEKKRERSDRVLLNLVGSHDGPKRKNDEAWRYAGEGALLGPSEEARAGARARGA